MTQQEYLIAWCFYLVGASCFYYIAWRATERSPFFELRQLLRLSLAVFLLVPWTTSTEYAFLSPAWIVSVSDFLLYGDKAFWRAGLVLVLALILTLLISTIWSLVSWRRSRRLKKNETNERSDTKTSVQQ